MRTLAMISVFGLLALSMPLVSAAPDSPAPQNGTCIACSCTITVSGVVQCTVNSANGVINYTETTIDYVVGVTEGLVAYAHGEVQCVLQAPPGGYPVSLYPCLPNLTA